MAENEPTERESTEPDAPVANEDAVAAAPADEATATETAPPREVIVIDAPVAPRPKGNRGLGLALALIGTVAYVAILAALALLIPTLSGGSVVDPEFYFPVLLFFIAELIVTVVLNRAGWWAHIIGSALVGVAVWLGSASLLLVSAGMFSMNQTEANDTFFAALFSPIVVVASLLAREIAVWTGAILSRRGRRLKVVNAEAQEAFEREQAELIPTA